MKKTVAFFAAASLSLLACSSSKGTTGGPASTSGADAGATFTSYPPSPTTWIMKATAPASDEIFKCQYVSMPATPGWVVGGKNEFTVGSHHLLLYKTDLTAIPAGEDGVGDCYEGDDGGPTPDFMNHIRGVVYPSATPVQTLTFPAAVGLPYVANEVYLFQVHYLNATATDINAEVDVHLDIVSSGITTNAGVLFFYDPFIDVLPNATAKAGMRCPIPNDITVFTSGSHQHARGVGVQAYVDTSTAATTPFYTSTNWASPTVDTTSFQVKAGSFIRYYCDYDNTQGPSEYIQGPSADVNEMCMFIGMYYPAMTTDVEQCDNGDEYGTGTTSCLDTLNTLQTCPEEDPGPEGINFTECVQKAFVSSCPNVSAPLTTFLNCSSTSCSAQCGSGGPDAGTTTSACTSCITANCASQYLACSGLTGCN